MKVIIFICFLSISVFSQSWIDSWQKATVALGIVDSILYRDNDTTYYQNYFRVVGTGILFYVKVDTFVIPALVTAKHVFYHPEENWTPKEINIRFSWDDNRSIYEYFGINIKLVIQNQIQWIPHKDSTIDLACYPLLISDSLDLILTPYSSIANEEDIFEGAAIYVLGYPGSVGKEFWTKAVLRQGIIAWVDHNNFNNNKILIDCDVFPGNSGGPVFKIPTGVDKKGNFVLGGQVKFLGIVSQRRFSETPVKINNQDIVDSLGNKLYSFESMGIGVIEPAIKVEELLYEVNKILNNGYQLKRNINNN